MLIFIIAYFSEYSEVSTWMQSKEGRSSLMKTLNATTDRCVVFEVEDNPKKPMNKIKISIKQINRAMGVMITRSLPNYQELLKTQFKGKKGCLDDRVKT